MPRPKKPEPVSEEEVKRVVLAAIAKAFEGRHLDEGTARRGLAIAAHEIAVMHLREVARKG